MLFALGTLGSAMPQPVPKDQQDFPRRIFCPQCDRPVPHNLNLVQVNIDGNAAMRIAGWSVPSPCPWCGEPAIKEVAVEQSAPAPSSVARPSGIWKPGMQ